MKILQGSATIIYMVAILFVLFMIGRGYEKFAQSDYLWVLPVAIVVLFGGMFLLSRFSHE